MIGGIKRRLSKSQSPNAGLEPLGKVSAPVLAQNLRKEEEGSTSGKQTALPGQTRPGIAAGNSSTSSPKALGGKPARERDRLTFFSSLKRKASGGDQPSLDENGNLHRQVGLLRSSCFYS